MPSPHPTNAPLTVRPADPRPLPRFAGTFALGGALPFDAAPDLLPGLQSPLHLVATLAAATLAGFGTLATASLIGYSPTRLTQLLVEAGQPEPAKHTDDIDRRDAEYLVVAAASTAVG